MAIILFSWIKPRLLTKKNNDRSIARKMLMMVRMVKKLRVMVRELKAAAKVCCPPQKKKWNRSIRQTSLQEILKS